MAAAVAVGTVRFTVPVAAPVAAGHAPATGSAAADHGVTPPGAPWVARAGRALLPPLPLAVAAEPVLSAVDGPPPPSGPDRATSDPSHRWSWPLDPRPEVARPFVRPATRYGVGHRGVDLLGHAGQPVLAVDDGVVSHVGVIAGRVTVTVVHASGLRSTYEPVTATVSRGEQVVRGSPVGSLTGVGSHCGALACLHLGALREDDYVDPLSLLGGARVRLLPLH